MSHDYDSPDEAQANLYSAAILDALEATWDREEAPGLPDGDRVFIRYIHRDPENAGWDDWRLGAVLPREGKEWGLDWIVEHGSTVRGTIHDAVMAGRRYGKFTDPANDLTVWWCLSKYDGPEKRVSDWASVPGRQS